MAPIGSNESRTSSRVAAEYHGVPRVVKRNRMVIVLALAGVALVGGGATAYWGRTRWSPDLMAEASAAYSRGAWDRTALLAHQRLRQAPEDLAAWRLAARAAAQQD